MWIARHGHRMLDVTHGVQIRDDVILKVSALINVNMGQNPIDVKSFVN